MGARFENYLRERELEQRRMDEQNAIDRVKREQRVREGRATRMGLPEPERDWAKPNMDWII